MVRRLFVEAGSFTAAARLLGMPKTTVSRRIAALEREVGVRLVQRTTRSLNMTEAGRLYYEQSSQALRTIEDANLRLAEARAEPSGTIRGGRHAQSGREPDRPRFPHRDFPDSTLIARKLGSTHKILCASPDYLARRGVPVASTDLARHHCVIAGPSTGSAHWVLDGPRGQETVAVSGRFAANEMQAVVAAAIAATASLNFPTRSLRRLSGAGGCACVLGDYTTPVGGLYAVYPSSRHVSPLVKEFIELAAERLAATETGEDDKAVAVFNQSFG